MIADGVCVEERLGLGWVGEVLGRRTTFGDRRRPCLLGHCCCARRGWNRSCRRVGGKDARQKVESWNGWERLTGLKADCEGDDLGWSWRRLKEVGGSAGPGMMGRL